MVKVTQFVVGDMSGAIAEYLLLSVDIDGKDYKVDSFEFFDTGY